MDVLEPLSEEELEGFARHVPTFTSGGQTIYKPEYRSEALFMLKNGRERIPKVAPGRVRAHAR